MEGLASLATFHPFSPYRLLIPHQAPLCSGIDAFRKEKPRFLMDSGAATDGQGWPKTANSGQGFTQSAQNLILADQGQYRIH